MAALPIDPHNSSASDQQANLDKGPETKMPDSEGMDVSGQIYSCSIDGQIRQGEILSNVPQIKLDIAGLREGKLVARTVVHPYAIVISQDCDCEQDFRERESGQVSGKTMPSVLICEVVTAAELRGTAGINGGIWGQVKINKHERYQFLEKVPADRDRIGIGLPELGLDFKRYFTVPTEELYFRIQKGEIQRRCKLDSPYLEHFALRFGYFLSRVALPADHSSESIK